MPTWPGTAEMRPPGRQGAAFAMPADWPAPPGVVAFSTLRHGAGVSRPPFDRFNLGDRSGDDVAAVAHNRALLVEQAGLPSSPCWLRQVHGVEVRRFGEGDRVPGGATSSDDPDPVAGAGPPPAAAAEAPEADAAVTGAAGVVLAILTADCLPVVLAARDGSDIGAAHAGWRGLAAGVLEATVAAMDTPPDRLQAWLGPAAGPDAYEIGAEVRDAFVGIDPGAASAFTGTRPGHWRVDLYALARRRLVAAGLRPGAIHSGGLCTISDPGRFYSYRRDGRTGRLATLVWRKALD